MVSLPRMTLPSGSGSLENSLKVHRESGRLFSKSFKPYIVL